MAAAKKGLKKTDLVDYVRDTMECTKVAATELVQGLFDMIAKEMSKGSQVDVAGFGKFVGYNKKAREVRNPATGEKIKKPAERVPKFRASKALKETVSGVKK
jgi:DNA-binding protein HU-beta